jgi:CBS-domain-containing membrane protein
MDALLTDKDLVLMVGSFGATAVLVYSAIDSPLAQVQDAL